MRTYLLLLGLLAVTVYSCTNKEAAAPDTGPVPSGCDAVEITAADVYAVITSRCTGCHSGSTAPKGADFSTLNKFKSFVSSNEATFRLRALSAQADMPPNGGPLRQSLRDSISCWIEKGMPE
jgi:cytochrome c5